MVVIEKNNIPEIKKFKENKNIIFKFGVGGYDKKNSSSLIINNFRNKFL